ncbi:DUF6338 family protein [Paenarthrobacter nicotinovorans]|uniref:DUF6338 family protein n=1 Tax=Paenarthrobacter nicotinovorans TaxID=29320 RepID=UPI003D67F7C4
MPTSWTALLLFLLVVVPGLAFDVFSQRRRPNADESVFREASRVVQASIWLAAPGLGLALVLFQAVSDGAMPRWGKIIGGEGRYLEENDWRLLLAVAAYLIGSVGAAFVADLVLRRMHGGTLTSTHSQWRQAFRKDRPEGAQTFVRITMTSGERWAGLVAHYSADLEVGGRELILREPILGAKAGSDDFLQVDGLGALILKGDNIDAIQVFYPAVTAEESKDR